MTQDAHGPLRRGLVMTSCNTSTLAEQTALSVKPYLNMVAQITGFPTVAEIC
jgi:hypothetical protein